MGVEFKSIPEVPQATIAAFIKKAFAEHAGADAVYILGSSLEALPLIAPLERERRSRMFGGLDRPSRSVIPEGVLWPRRVPGING